MQINTVTTDTRTRGRRKPPPVKATTVKPPKAPRRAAKPRKLRFVTGITCPPDLPMSMPPQWDPMPRLRALEKASKAAATVPELLSVLAGYDALCERDPTRADFSDSAVARLNDAEDRAVRKLTKLTITEAADRRTVLEWALARTLPDAEGHSDIGAMVVPMIRRLLAEDAALKVAPLTSSVDPDDDLLHVCDQAEEARLALESWTDGDAPDELVNRYPDMVAQAAELAPVSPRAARVRAGVVLDYLRMVWGAQPHASGDEDIAYTFVANLAGRQPRVGAAPASAGPIQAPPADAALLQLCAKADAARLEAQGLPNSASDALTNAVGDRQMAATEAASRVVPQTLMGARTLAATVLDYGEVDALESPDMDFSARLVFAALRSIAMRGPQIEPGRERTYASYEPRAGVVLGMPVTVMVERPAVGASA